MCLWTFSWPLTIGYITVSMSLVNHGDFNDCTMKSYITETIKKGTLWNIWPYITTENTTDLYWTYRPCVTKSHIFYQFGKHGDFDNSRVSIIKNHYTHLYHIMSVNDISMQVIHMCTETAAKCNHYIDIPYTWSTCANVLCPVLMDNNKCNSKITEHQQIAVINELSVGHTVVFRRCRWLSARLQQLHC